MATPFDTSALPNPEEQDRAKQLDLTQGFALQRSPEEAAKALRLAKDRGVGFADGERQLKEAPPTGPSWSDLVRRAPVLAERLSQPEQAAVMHDDVKQLEGIERFFGGWRETPRAVANEWKRGKLTSELAYLAYAQSEGRATPETLKRMDEIEKEMESIPQAQQGFFPGIPAQVAQSAPLMVRGMLQSWPEIGQGALFGAGAGAIAGAPAGGVGALPGAAVGARAGAGMGFTAGVAKQTGMAEQGLAYRELIKLPGATPEDAKLASQFVGIINGSLEILPTEMILKAAGGGMVKRLAGKEGRDLMKRLFVMPTFKNALARFSGRLAAGAFFEGTTEFLQEISVMVAGRQISEKTAAQPFDWARAFDAAKGGAQGGLGFVTLPTVVEARHDLNEVAKSRDRQNFYKELGQLSSDSKLRARMPEEFKAYLDKIDEKYGAVESVSVPAKSLVELFQKESLDPGESMPEVARQLSEAQNSPGAEVVVPISDFATHIAPLKNFNLIEGDIRVGDELTLNESKGVEERAKKIIEESSKFTESSDPVYEAVATMLKDQGMSEQTTQHYAALWSAFVNSRAERLKVDPMEYYRTIGLQISNADIIKDVVDRTGVPLTPEQKILEEKALAGDRDAMAKLRGQLDADPLTGANSSYAFGRFVGGFDEHGKPKAPPVGFWLQMDANDLKKANDLFGGHPAGNAYLKLLGETLGKAVRSNRGKFFRSGGDEFTGYWPVSMEKEARAAAEAIKAAINAAPSLYGDKFRGSVSVGLGGSFEAADAASYKAKEAAVAAGRSGSIKSGLVADLTKGDFFFAESPSLKDDLARAEILLQKIEPQNTAAFKKWFKDSKVVDEDGAPAIVYHGTNWSFDRFTMEKANPENYHGVGAYFSTETRDVEKNYASQVGPDLTSRVEWMAEQIVNELTDQPAWGTKEYEEMYAKARAEAREKLVGPGPNVMPVYLSIQNPVVLTPNGGTRLEAEMTVEKGYEDDPTYKFPVAEAFAEVAKNYDLSFDAREELISKIRDEEIDRGTAWAVEKILRSSPELLEVYGDNGQTEGFNLIRQMWEKAGFDGIKLDAGAAFPNMAEAGTWHYVPFKPTQIKSALGNRGTFSSRSTNILYQPVFEGTHFISAVEEAVKGAKQEKGDAKSWWSVISKTAGVKKEELEWMGLKRWLDTVDQVKSKDFFDLTDEEKEALGMEEHTAEFLEQLNPKGIITKDQVMKFVGAHKITIAEKVLGAGGDSKLTDAQRNEIADDLNNHGISVNRHHWNTFSYTYSESEESHDYEAILNHLRNNTGEISHQESQEIEQILGDGDYSASEEEQQARVDRINEILGDGGSASASLSSNNNIRLDGWIDGEVETDDVETIIDQIRDSEGRRTADEVREMIEKLQAEGGFSDDSRQYADYSLKSDALTIEGTGRELLFYAPGEDTETRQGYRWDSAHFGDEGKGLLAHARVAEHNIDGHRVLFIEEIQSDRMQHARDAVGVAKERIRELEKSIKNTEVEIEDYKRHGNPDLSNSISLIEKWKEEITRLKKQTGFDSVAAIYARLGDPEVVGTGVKFTDPVTGRIFTTMRSQDVRTLRWEAAQVIMEELSQAGEAVVDAPLKTVWEEFAVKRLLMYAAEQGIDRVAWTTGEQQIERWSKKVRENIGEIRYRKNAEGRIGVEFYDTSGDQVHPQQDGQHFTSPPGEFNYTPAKLEMVIGKEMVRKIVDGPETTGGLKGDEIVVGGQGFRLYYNQSMPSIFEKLLGKFGAEKPKLIEHTGLRSTDEFVYLKIEGADWPTWAKWVQKATLNNAVLVDKLRDTVAKVGNLEERTKWIENIDEEIAAIPGERKQVEALVADLKNPTDAEREELANRGLIYSDANVKKYGFTDEFWKMHLKGLEYAKATYSQDVENYNRALSFTEFGIATSDTVPHGTPVPSWATLEDLDRLKSGLLNLNGHLERFILNAEVKDSIDPQAELLRKVLWGEGGYSNTGRGRVASSDFDLFYNKFKLTIPELTSDIKITRQVEGTSTPGEPVWSVDVPPSFVEHVASKGLPLFQPGQNQGDADFRGSFQTDDLRQWMKITLTGKANLSTFLHESGHAFFELLHRDAAMGHAQSMEDLNTIYNWLGAKQNQKLTVSQLERFARGFEEYLMRGRAPSSKMETAFAAFKSWLVFIYKTLTRLDTGTTDEVRAVMDRLLATDEEIKKYEGANQPMAPLPNMTPQQHRAYLAKWQAAVGTRQTAAESEALHNLYRGLKDAKNTIRAQVEQEAKTRKDFNAWSVLTRGTTLDGSLIPLDIENKKLDAEKVPPDRKFRAISEKGGMDPEAMAPFLGYSNGDELIRALTEMPNRSAWTKEQTQLRMAEKYPEADLSQVVPKTQKAMHEGGDVASVMADELALIDRQLGAKVDKLEKAAIHRAAKMQVAEMTQQEMKPGRLMRAELAAAQETAKALGKRDFYTAREAKRRQLFNHFAYLEVSKAVDEINSIRDYLSRFDELSVRKRLQQAGDRYIDAVDALLDGVEFTRQTNTALERRASLEEYLNEMEADGDLITIPPRLRAEVGLTNFRQMKLDDLRALRDSVKNIETQARLKNRIFDGRKTRNFIQTTGQLAAQVKANLGTGHAETNIGDPTWGEGVREWIRKGRADLTKIEFLCRALDGGKTAGWAHELIFQPLVDAQNKKLVMSKKITDQLMQPFRDMTLADRLRFDSHVDFLGYRIRVREVIALVLNLGNEGNRMKLLKGFHMDEAEVMKRVGEILRPQDLDLVEHIWKTINSLWPDIESLAKRTAGVAPVKIEPASITINGRTLTGGYYPIVYNRRLSHKAEMIAQRKAGGDLWENNFMKPSTERGFMEERTKFFAPISLSLDVIPSHINEVVHYLTHYEAVQAVDRLTSNKLVKEAVTEGLGREMYQLFRPWLQAIANDGVVHDHTDFIDRTLRRLRLGSSIAILGFKVSTGLKQLFGVTTTTKEIGPKYAAIGVGIFMKKLASGTAFSDVESVEFEHIDQQHDRDMAQMFERATSGFSEFGHLKHQMAHYALAWMMLNQKVVNAITWYGAREKALDEHHARPNDYADSVVRMTQSGGGIKDLAHIQRGSETKRLFVVMYTYFSVMANSLIEPIPKGKAKLPVLAARWWWLVTLPVMLDMLSTGAHPEDGDDPEKWLKLFAAEQARYAGRTIPLGGTMLDAFVSDRETRYASWLDTLVKGTAAAGRVAKKGGDVTPGTVKTVADLLGAFTGLPSGAAKNAYGYFDQFDHMDEPIQNLLFRPPHDWE